jgi:hypothetical protein
VLLAISAVYAGVELGGIMLVLLGGYDGSTMDTHPVCPPVQLQTLAHIALRLPGHGLLVVIERGHERTLNVVMDIVAPPRASG